MKLFCSLVLLLFCIHPFSAQFAKIVDRDGYVNIRESASAKSKVIGKIKSDEIVYISDKGNDSEGWSYINYEKQKGVVFSKYLSGYVHNSRLQKISSFLNIPSLDSSDKATHFICCGVEVEIKTQRLDYEKHKGSFKKQDGYYTYKGKYALGVWGRFPSLNTYQSISGSIGKDQFEIPIQDLENLFSINNELAECYYDKESNTLYILLNNADGSEFYIAILVIADGKYKGIVVADDH